TKIVLSGIVLATVGALFSADFFLARTQESETRAEAERAYNDGMRLLSGNRAEDAVEALRKAHTLDRADQRYSLGLASALLASGKVDDAQTLVAETLELSPNDGASNLLEARLMVREQKFQQAESYYHRAIYGIWGTNARRKLRFRAREKQLG